MRILELFSGTGSFGKSFEGVSCEIVSVDIVKKFNPVVCADLLTWDYRVYPVGHFDIIWASPPCNTFSRLNQTPRKLEMREKIGRPLLHRTLEIIRYFNPKYWVIENPDSGDMKKEECMKDLHYAVADYCKYGFPYRKRTRFWNNMEEWKPKMCKCDCVMIKPETKKHRYKLGGQFDAVNNGYDILKPGDFGYSKTDWYRIPPLLCSEIRSFMIF